MFEIRIQQDIRTLLNKYTKIDVADKIVEEVHKNYIAGMKFEKLNFIINQIFIQIYEKACVEEIFVQFYV